MKTNKFVKAAPIATLSLALLLSSCSATSVPETAVSTSASQSPAVNQSATFTTKVTSDLKPFVDNGQTWALQNQGVTLFAGNKAVSVEKLNRSADIQVRVFNLDDGTITGETTVGNMAKTGESEYDYPDTQSIVRHDGKDFLAVTQTGNLSTNDAPATENDSDVKVSFIELDNPTKVIDFGQKDTYSLAEIPPLTNGVRHMVPLTGGTNEYGESESYYATPAGITEVEGSVQSVIALTQGEPLVQGQLGIGEYEMRVPGGWDVLKIIADGEKYPLGDIENLAVDGNFISFGYSFAIEKPYHGSYLVDLEHRKITQTSREDSTSEGLTVKGLQNSLDGDFLIMEDSAYNKRTGKMVSFKGTKGTGRVLLRVANQDGTRAYGTMGEDHARVLVDLTTKKVQKIESGGKESSEIPVWITPEDTVVFKDKGTLSGVRTN